jgi:O-succinylbenzoic acid--CoA ligase
MEGDLRNLGKAPEGRPAFAAALLAWLDAGLAGDGADVGSGAAAGEAASFMREFARSASGTGPVFLNDPGWGEEQRAQAMALARESKIGEPPQGLDPGRGWIQIPSGGTGGRLKFARHDERGIGAAVRGFCAHFGFERVDAVGVLPLHHVSGFMAWMRCALTGGRYVPWAWGDLEAGRLPPETPLRGGCISLVPTQLRRLIGSARTVEWLRGFDVVALGGGPLWPALAKEAGDLKIPVSPGYGMTETAAMVAALPPAEFLLGGLGCGRPMPHARIDLAPDGRIRIEGDSVFLGYYPGWRSGPGFIAEDRGTIGSDGSLQVLGRSDALIITGGKKVDPGEIEALLRCCGEFEEIAVIGVPDPDWGQAVVAAHSPGPRPPDLARVESALRDLAAFKRPKRFAIVSPWPSNAQGKVNRAELLRRLTS